MLLAAGAGVRYGAAKALVDTGAGPWVLRALDTLAGCEPRLVVIGARADDVRRLLPDSVSVVHNPDHAQGMGSSLRAGLAALARGTGTDAALIMLVDLPDVGRPVIDRVVAAAGPGTVARAGLVRATYRGRPGHPVLIGRDHWPGVLATATGDEGARGYLRAHPTTPVECGDLATGRDVDRPDGATGPAGEATAQSP